ncbi:MAG: hypothetical protein ACLFQV_12460 [Vulcanimicrobiota bacterium]
MINWKSLSLFLLTLLIIIGILTTAGFIAYGRGIDFLSEKHPEILITPKNLATYKANPTYVETFKEYKDSNYSIMLPPGYSVFQVKDEPAINLEDPNRKWTITLDEKLLRYEESLESEKHLNNPEGDYYILLENIYSANRNPILLAQKILYLPSSATTIKNIETPHAKGFYIISEQGEKRTEIYRLFDKYFWHNITVTIHDPAYPHSKIETIIATLKNSNPAIE